MTITVETLPNQCASASSTLHSLTLKQKFHDAPRASGRVLSVIMAFGIGGCAPVPVTIDTEVVANLPRQVALAYLKNVEPVKQAKYMEQAKRWQCQYTDTTVRRSGEEPVLFEKTSARATEISFGDSSIFSVTLLPSVCRAYEHDLYPNNTAVRSKITDEVSKTVNALASLGVTIVK